MVIASQFDTQCYENLILPGDVRRVSNFLLSPKLHEFLGVPEFNDRYAKRKIARHVCFVVLEDLAQAHLGVHPRTNASILEAISVTATFFDAGFPQAA